MRLEGQMFGLRPQLPHYTVDVVFLDSTEFKLHFQRKRVYIIGVKKSAPSFGDRCR